MAADVVLVGAPAPQLVQVVPAPIQVVQVVERGPAGPEGPIADQDNVLEFVDAAVADYFVMHPDHWTYDQVQADDDWLFTHPLPFNPQVTVTDTAGEIQEGVVTYPAPNQVRIQFNVPISGEAVLS